MDALKHTKETYVDYPLFLGDDAKIECHTIKLVKARRPHACFFGLNGDGHGIKPGDHARYETALVDGSYWGKYYVCIPCLDREIADIYGGDDD